MRDRIARGALWIGATRVLVNLLSVVSSVMLARLLVPADFGLVATATTVFGILSSFTELSLGSALVRHAAPTDEHFNTAWTLGFIRALALALLLSAGAPLFANAFEEPRLTRIFFALAATIAAGGLTNPKLVIFQRHLEFWQDFILQVSTKLVGLVISLGVAFSFRSYWAIILGMIGAQVVQIALSYALRPYRPRVSFQHSRELLDYSIWLSLGQAVSTLNWKSDPLLVGYFLGPTALGHYTFGDNLASLPSREAIAPLSQTLFPAFSKISRDPEAVRSAYMRAQSVLFMIALPIGCGFAAVAEPVVMFLVGAKWAPSVFVIQALAAVFALQTLTNPLQPLAMALGETRALFRRDLVSFAIRIPLIATGAILGGVRGVILARIVSGLLGMMLNVALVSRITGISLRRQLVSNSRTFIATALMVTVVLALLHLPSPSSFPSSQPVLWLAVAVALGATMYLLAIYVLWNAAGRQGGPESEALNALKDLWAKRKR